MNRGPASACVNRPLYRKTLELSGIVQGVGFRPTLFRLARAADLGGWVQNRAGTVRLVLVGPLDRIDSFVHRLPAGLLPPAAIRSVCEVSCEALSADEDIQPFRIAESDGDDAVALAIPADLAVCGDCRAEVRHPADRRYGYAFTSCTLCGPRYTVIHGMPYDRARTTMNVFPLCAACRREYEDPADRRFHAESTACPVCGPQLSLLDAAGQPVSGDPLQAARAALAAGRVVAVRGLGGFLLAVDASNRVAIEALRRRKTRPDKPFAVMAADLAVVRGVCHVPAAAVGLLEGAMAPIVILDMQAPGSCEPVLPLDLLTPDMGTLGVMLPTTPLHDLLASPLADDPTPRFDFLVMTSGNRGGEPICLTNDEALDRLAGIADLFLVHDREINLRNDDSLCAVQRGEPQVWRRARGFAPNPIALARPVARCALGMGADLKNAICLAYEQCLVPSPHVGDLETPEAMAGLEQVVQSLPAFLQRTPQAVGVDLHPDMQSTRMGRRLGDALDIPVVAVQHHHAHAVACLAEHGEEHGLALVFDGTGLGPDGHVWGAELLEADVAGYVRLGTFAGVALPGGDAAVREPARQLVARWADAGVEITPQRCRALGVDPAVAAVWARQCERGLNAPLGHAAGRLFDSFSMALGVAPVRITYEGQTAIRLEGVARQHAGDEAPALPFTAHEQDDLFTVEWREAFRMLSETAGVAAQAPRWAMAVHRAVAEAAREMVEYGFARTDCRVVALSGGVMMNRILTDLLVAQLESIGARVLLHRVIPPNDGCIAIGQSVIAGMVGQECPTYLETTTE